LFHARYSPLLLSLGRCVADAIHACLSRPLEFTSLHLASHSPLFLVFTRFRPATHQFGPLLSFLSVCFFVDFFVRGMFFPFLAWPKRALFLRFFCLVRAIVVGFLLPAFSPTSSCYFNRGCSATVCSPPFMLSRCPEQGAASSSTRFLTHSHVFYFLPSSFLEVRPCSPVAELRAFADFHKSSLDIVFRMRFFVFPRCSRKLTIYGDSLFFFSLELATLRFSYRKLPPPRNLSSLFFALLPHLYGDFTAPWLSGS